MKGILKKHKRIGFLGILVVIALALVTMYARSYNNKSGNLVTNVGKESPWDVIVYCEKLGQYSSETGDPGVHKLSILELDNNTIDTTFGDVYCGDMERAAVLDETWRTKTWQDVLGLEGYGSGRMQWLLDHIMLDSSEDKEFDSGVINAILREYYVTTIDANTFRNSSEDLYSINQQLVWYVYHENKPIDGQAYGNSSPEMKEIINIVGSEAYKHEYYSRANENSMSISTNSASISQDGVIGPFDINGNGGYYRLNISASVGGSAVSVRLYKDRACTQVIEQYDEYNGECYAKIDSYQDNKDIKVDLNYKYAYITDARFWYTHSANNANPQPLVTAKKSYQTGTASFSGKYEVSGDYKINLGKKSSENPDGPYIAGVTYEVTKSKNQRQEGTVNVTTKSEPIQVVSTTIDDKDKYDSYKFNETESERAGYALKSRDILIKVYKTQHDHSYDIDHIVISAIGSSTISELTISDNQTYWILSDGSATTTPSEEQKKNAELYIRWDGSKTITYIEIDKPLEGKYYAYFGKKSSNDVDGAYIPGITYDVQYRLSGNESTKQLVTQDSLSEIIENGVPIIRTTGGNDYFRFTEHESSDEGFIKNEAQKFLNVGATIEDGKYVIGYINFYYNNKMTQVKPSETYWIVDGEWVQNPNDEQKKIASGYISVAADKLSFTYVDIDTPIKGDYNLKITKIDEDTNETVNGVEFEINNEKKTTGEETNDGTITIGSETITKDALNDDVYTIKEANVGENVGLVKLKDPLKITVKKGLNDSKDAYIVKSASFESGETAVAEGDPVEIEVTLEDEQTATAKLQVVNNTVELTVPNKRVIEGDYSLYIKKVKDDGKNTPVGGVHFVVNNITTEDTNDTTGLVKVFENKAITRESLDSEEYTIKEIAFAEGTNIDLIKLKEEVTIIVNKGLDSTGKKYIVTSASFLQSELAENNGSEVEKQFGLEDGTDVTVKLKVENGDITVTIPNRPKGKYNLNIGKKSTENNEYIGGKNYTPNDNDFLAGATFEVVQYLNVPTNTQITDISHIPASGHTYVSSESGKSSEVKYSDNSNIDITQVDTKDVYLIKEINAPRGYNTPSIDFYLIVNKKYDESTKEYQISSINVVDISGNIDYSILGKIDKSVADKDLTWWGWMYEGKTYRVDLNKDTNTITFVVGDSPNFLCNL